MSKYAPKGKVTVLLLGGAGLTGMAIARRVSTELRPDTVVIAASRPESAQRAVAELSTWAKEDPSLEDTPGTRNTVQSISWQFASGNIFLRREYAGIEAKKLLADPDRRKKLYDDLFGSFEDAYAHSHLAQLILEHQPSIIIDCINTATNIAYVDADAVSARVRIALDAHAANAAATAASSYGANDTLSQSVEELLVGQALPLLARHVTILHRAMREAGTSLYLKVGTTGTGGMGLHIPYTHSEDKPSAPLIAKSAVAFAHTGLLFLMARTAGGPRVKEVKPAALIGYASIKLGSIYDRKLGGTVKLYRPRRVALGGDGSVLVLREEAVTYGTDTTVPGLQGKADISGADHKGERQAPEESGRPYTALGELQVPVVDTGENGVFTRGEFAAITAPGQMEYVTPEEIARIVVDEIEGRNTGHDVIGALDASVLGPSYRAGFLRGRVLTRLAALEQTSAEPSVALGQLGPPQLSKLLWEAHILKYALGSVEAFLSRPAERVAAELTSMLVTDEASGDAGREDVEGHNMSASMQRAARAMTSLGIPILLPDETTLIRGPWIRIPQSVKPSVELKPGDVDRWAQSGWVDLRAANIELWQARFRTVLAARETSDDEGSAMLGREVYLPDDIEIGEVVAWIFNNEGDGYRVK